ncbi:unnamed protein product [Allacma fusca]|uniref:Carboxylesterase type B domain-containing protein n=1 Tax=Allacma fusca TaxID=39272 RepID=A0A8J2LHI2_9HEXA|nr:unnamed protein product [Allacma fusca]
MRTLIFALVVSWASIEVSCKNAFSLGSDQTVVTSTKLGGLKGTILTSRGGHEYYAFLGVPFAEKTERFQAAQPVKPWEGVRDSTKISSICPQRSVALGPGGDVIGDEDCLYLNVFTPAQEVR